MKNASTRLSRLEQRVTEENGVISWDWANDPYYLGLPDERKAEIEVIMRKLRPHLPHNPTAAMNTLALEELEELEKFYIARFGMEALADVAQSR